MRYYSQDVKPYGQGQLSTSKGRDPRRGYEAVLGARRAASLLLVFADLYE